MFVKNNMGRFEKLNFHAEFRKNSFRKSALCFEFKFKLQVLILKICRPKIKIKL